MFNRFAALALRNLLRNTRRSLLTSGAVLLAVTASICLQGFGNGMLRLMAQNYIHGSIGAIQIHRRGFLEADTDPLKLDLESNPALEAKIARVPGVVAVAPRITFDAMLSNGAESTMVMVIAVDADRESRVCPDRWATSKGARVGAGDSPDALVGQTLAEGLGAQPGATLTLLSATQTGASNALELNVRALSAAPDPMTSKRIVVVPLGYAQRLLAMPGRVTELAVEVANPAQVAEIADRLSVTLGPDYDVRTWLRILPAADAEIHRIHMLLKIIASILFILVLSGIVNTMLMGVYERVREIGTMLAVGVQRRQVVGLFLGEAMGLGVVGSIAGAALGLTLVATFGARGIDVTPPGSNFSAVLRPFVSANYVAGAIVIAAIGAVAAAAYPAWRASKLTPVEALRAV